MSVQRVRGSQALTMNEDTREVGIDQVRRLRRLI
jgi:hypothetical protein